jgi:D-lyxose ketol-isomerase
MKRSEVNTILLEAATFIAEHRFHLPPFASWTPENWKSKGLEVAEIFEHGLGWDVTDFGSDDFEKTGLFLFTIRNGNIADLERGTGKVYAEKLLVVAEGQVTPAHFHNRKTEDIINRGGGTLALELHWANDQDGLSGREVSVTCDGVKRNLSAGGIVRLEPGESITLPTRLYHKFWAEGARVLVGEVSTVNDDQTDNHFLEPVGRFPKIEEDIAPTHLLVGDYERFYRFATQAPANEN